MWRKLLKGILYTILILGTLGGLMEMISSPREESAIAGFIAIIVVWLSASVFGLILEVATDISKIAVNSEETKKLLERISFTSNNTNFNSREPIDGELKEEYAETITGPKNVSQQLKLADTWICKCGKENSRKNNYCIECGEKRP